MITYIHLSDEYQNSWAGIQQNLWTISGMQMNLRNLDLGKKFEKNKVHILKILKCSIFEAVTC